MTTSPPDLSRLRIDRSEPAPSTGGRGRVTLVVAGILVLLVAAALLWLRLAPQGTEVRVGVAAATGGGTASATGITANGYVVARTKASVSAKVPGRLAYLGVSEGSVVRRGEVIARLENADYRAALAAAGAGVEDLRIQTAQAEREFRRAEKLAAQSLISATELENTRTRFESLQARHALARAQRDVAAANLDNTSVVAPFDGTVLRKDAEVGEFVAPSTAGGGLTRSAIATMADLRTLEVEVDVNEAYIAQVANGQPARITLDAYPDTSFAGTVRQVVPTADRQKATVQVKVAILDRDPRILPEMGAKVVFVRGEGATAAAAPRRVLVPGAAIGQGRDGTQVWVVEDGRVTARAVDVGATRGDQVEIRKGLNGGESVVLGAPAGLKDGARVRVRSS
jgi:HlyD family secretion protein